MNTRNARPSICTFPFIFSKYFSFIIYINKSLNLAVKFYNMLLRIVTTYQAIDKIEKIPI